MSVTASELETELYAIRNLIRAIRPPHHRHPSAFHDDKDAVAGRLSRLLERMHGADARKPKLTAAEIRHAGRVRIAP